MTTYATTASLLPCWLDIRILGLAVTPEDEQTAQIEVVAFEPSVAIPAYFQSVGETLSRRFSDSLREQGILPWEESKTLPTVALETPMPSELFKLYPSLQRLYGFLQDNLSQVGVMQQYERMPIEVFADTHGLELEAGLVEKLEKVRSEAGFYRAFVDKLVEQGVQETRLRELQEWQRVQAQLALEEVGSLASVEPKPSVPELRRVEDDDSPSP